MIEGFILGVVFTIILISGVNYLWDESKKVKPSYETITDYDVLVSPKIPKDKLYIAKTYKEK